MQAGKMSNTPRAQKHTVQYILLISVLVLMFMPFMAVFNDLLTRIVMQLDFYQFLQRVVVPIEIRMVGVLLLPFGFRPQIVGEYLSIGGSNAFLIEIAWNCVGWQSLLFFILTSWVGLQGDRYTDFSKFKAWFIGFLGTFFVNLGRIAAVVLIAYYFGQNVAIVFHDIGSTMTVLVWLIVFWWFVYRFVLEERKRFEIEETVVV